MIDLEEFDLHLKTLDASQWQKLFDLIPEIEITEHFGEWRKPIYAKDNTIPYWMETEIVSKTVRIIEELEIAPSFAWMGWKEGGKILNEELESKQYDTITLCKLLTAIIRANRFAEGYTISRFEDQSMIKILRNLEANMKYI